MCRRTGSNVAALADRSLSAGSGQRQQPVSRLLLLYNKRTIAEKLKAAASDPDRLAVRKGVIAELEQGNLRGMGGAGTPAVQKWRNVMEARGDEKYVVCNADESEPATFKDRELLLRTPDLIVEGMIIAALLFRAKYGYVYIRHEYHDQIHAVDEAIKVARDHGAWGETYSAPVFRSTWKCS